jgi:hypothetical protein
MPCRLLLDVPGATPAQHSRALAAAQAVFDAAGLWPVVAELAYETRRAWIQRGFQAPEPSRSEMQAAATFALARRCALAACTDADNAPSEGQFSAHLAS